MSELRFAISRAVGMQITLDFLEDVAEKQSYVHVKGEVIWISGGRAIK